MESHRVGETGFPESGPSIHHSPYAVLPGINIPGTSFSNQQGSAFDLGELEKAIMLQGLRIGSDEAKASLFAGRPAATLEMFPSWPIRIQGNPTRGSSKSLGESTDSGSAQNALSSGKPETQLEADSSISTRDHHLGFDHQKYQDQQQLEIVEMAGDSSNTRAGHLQQQGLHPIAKPEKRLGTCSTLEKQLDAKTLRRLAQNREAARKSRLRKKAYVQQLESSRIKLTQLEQDLQRARTQGLLLGVGGGGNTNISSAFFGGLGHKLTLLNGPVYYVKGNRGMTKQAIGAALFDLEYARWLEDDHRHMSELRTALQAHLADGDLRVIVDGYISHYDEIFQLKGMAAKSDVFHLITGMWTSPAERCFLWMGGFRPSELIKMLMSQLDPLTEQQFLGICNLQQSTQQAEEALSQGLEQLQQSVIETIASGCITDGYEHMNMALAKLINLEGFVRQADNLRRQTLHQLRRILTVRQAARCFLVIGEYYGRLRALSSLWSTRPRETLISDDSSCQTTTDLQMMQSPQTQFPSF